MSQYDFNWNFLKTMPEINVTVEVLCGMDPADGSGPKHFQAFYTGATISSQTWKLADGSGFAYNVVGWRPLSDD